MSGRAIIFWLLATLSAHAIGEPAGCFKREQEIPDLFSEKLIKSVDTLTFDKAGSGKFVFHLLQYGSNHHTCAVSGYAFAQSQGRYVYKDMAPYWLTSPAEENGLSTGLHGEACEIRFAFSGAAVEISATASCRAFCGVRAHFGGVLQASKECQGSSL